MSNFRIDVGVGGFNAAMIRFVRESKPLVGFIKRISRFSTAQEKKHRKQVRNRRRLWRERFDRQFNPVSLCALQMRDDNQILRIPVVVAPRVAVHDTKPGSQSSTVFVVRKTEGVLIIVEFASKPPAISILKDNDKELLRFPFGMREPEKHPEDATIFGTARRECVEETFWELDDVEIPEFTEEMRLGEIRVSSDHTVHVFHVLLPWDTPIAPGEEQEAAFRAPVELVETYVQRGLFTQTHGMAWELAKRKGVIK